MKTVRSCHLLLSEGLTACLHDTKGGMDSLCNLRVLGNTRKFLGISVEDKNKNSLIKALTNLGIYLRKMKGEMGIPNTNIMPKRVG